MNNSNPLVTINLVVFNGQKYIRHCLNSIKNQTYQNIEVNIFDNNSTDGTKKIAKEEFPQFNLIESPKNLGTWPGQEEALKYSHGEYIVAISVDILLDEKFVEKAVEALKKDHRIGAVEAKIYGYTLESGSSEIHISKSNIIDTCGFKIFRSRRLINIGHGEEDRGQYDKEKEIFAVEGAVPVFRRRALDDMKIEGEIIDHDYFWYGDDFDLGWRMRLFGWVQMYSPEMIAYHDRKTTKTLRHGRADFIRIRKTIPLFKRRLDWRNTTLTHIKNEFASNLLKDLPFILWRQIKLWGYFIIFEPSMMLEIFEVLKFLPRMLRRRKEIMAQAKVTPNEMAKWFEAD